MDQKQDDSAERSPTKLSKALEEAATCRALAEASFLSADEKRKEVEEEHQKLKEHVEEELEDSLKVLTERLDLEQQRLRQEPENTLLSAMDAITHFYGSALLHKSEWIGAYTGLEGKLCEHELENEYPIPVLILSESKQGGWEDDPVRIEQEFSLTFVEPSFSGNYFRAKASEREQSLHAYTSRVATVVHSSLSLPGKSLHVAQDISSGDLSSINFTQAKELVLASSTILKERSFLEVYEDESYFSSYEFRSSIKSHFLRPSELLSEDENAQSFFEYTVGWDELEKKVLSYEYEEREQVVKNLLHCFAFNGQEHFHGVNTPLGKLFQHILDARKVQQEIDTECTRRIQELS